MLKYVLGVAAAARLYISDLFYNKKSIYLLLLLLLVNIYANIYNSHIEQLKRQEEFSCTYIFNPKSTEASVVLVPLVILKFGQTRFQQWHQISLVALIRKGLFHPTDILKPHVQRVIPLVRPNSGLKLPENVPRSAIASHQKKKKQQSITLSVG